MFLVKSFRIPEGSKTAKGRAVQNLINIEPDDKSERTSELMI